MNRRIRVRTYGGVRGVRTYAFGPLLDCKRHEIAYNKIKTSIGEGVETMAFKTILNKWQGPLIAYSVVFYLIPFLSFNIFQLTDDGFAIAIIYLLMLNSFTALIISWRQTQKFGFDFGQLVLLVALFCSSCFVFYNSSALPYIFGYLLMAGLGILVGLLIRKSSRKTVG